MSWENNVRRVVPYVPGEQPKEQDIVKLNTNENPYAPSPMVTKALREMRARPLRLYPDPKADMLVSAIAKEYGLSNDMVFAGIGSDDVLAMLFMTFFNSETPVLFPDITYSFYDVWAEMLRIPYETQPLDENFHIVPEDYMKENGGIVIANPNAPTGVAIPVATIEKIVKANPDSIVIVDEAYVDFGAESALPLVHKYDNVIITQTFSKSRSLAGLRIGYAMAAPGTIRYLNDVKYSFNSYTMNYPSIVLGTAALSDKEHFDRTCAKVCATRKWVMERFRDLGFKFEESSANFLFVTHPDIQARDIYNYLRANGVYVRWFDKPRIRNYLRITIGKDAQMDRLFECLEDMGIK